MELTTPTSADFQRWAARAPTDWSPIPSVADRAAWAKIAETIGRARVSHIVAQGDAAAVEPLPLLPATLWLEFARRGQREGYETPLTRRHEMATQLALAECFEDRGRFLDPLVDVVWAICEESSWCWPACQPDLADIDRPEIDLGAASTGLELAELDHLLGSRMPAAVRRRIRYEVDRRLFVPYLTRHDFGWMRSSATRPAGNWTAVCTAGVVGAACYLEPDPDRLGHMLFMALRSLDDYLQTFDQDGGTTEGLVYWCYGFGHFAVLAHLVEARTGGMARWMESPIARAVAQFPLRTGLSPGRYVNFSDCVEQPRLIPAQLVYLARRLDLPDLEVLAAQQPDDDAADDLTGITWAVRDLVWRCTPEAAQRPLAPSRHDFFGVMQWMVARANPADPNALVLAAKGGHNGEMHNHNDIGTIIVHLNQESTVADLGMGRYTKDYFGPSRYEHLATSSLGHSVPLPNGCAQREGTEFTAHLLSHQADGRQDLLALDLTHAYPAEADLSFLHRTVILHRGPAPWVELEDRVRFASRPGTLESVLISFGAARLDGPDAVVLEGHHTALRIHYDRTVVTPRIEDTQHVDLNGGARSVTRVCFTLNRPVDTSTIRLEMRPRLEIPSTSAARVDYLHEVSRR